MHNTRHCICTATQTEIKTVTRHTVFLFTRVCHMPHDNLPSARHGLHCDTQLNSS